MRFLLILIALTLPAAAQHVKLGEWQSGPNTLEVWRWVGRRHTRPVLIISVNREEARFSRKGGQVLQRYFKRAWREPVHYWTWVVDRDFEVFGVPAAIQIAGERFEVADEEQFKAIRRAIWDAYRVVRQ